LGELFEIGAGKTMSAAARDGTHKTPFLRTSNVLWDEIELSTIDEMAIPAHELAEKRVLPGDLLVCEGGDIGRAAVWNGEVETMSFQNHLHRLRPIAKDVEPRFYVYFLQCAFTQLGIFEGAGNTTTIPNLSRNRLAGLDVPHPPLSEQKAIVEGLACVRSAMTVQARAAAVAQELQRAAMRQLFQRGLQTENQSEVEDRNAPTKWSAGKLGDFALFQRGFDITKTSQVAGNIPVVSSGGIKSYHDQAAARGPGVLVGRKGSIGSLHFVEGDYWPHDTTLWCTDFRGNHPKFVYYLLHTLNLKKLDSGATNPALNRNFLHDEPIRWPNTEEQREIVTILDAIHCKIDLHKRRQAVLADLFKALLYKLMTGEIRSDDLDLSVPAPSLLKGSLTAPEGTRAVAA
jgi:type I restriction enzyme S subunit